MKDKVTIPKAEYDRLCALEEELSDIQAALAVEARIVRGEEDLIPASVVDRLIDGEPPLRVWREFRNLTQGRPRPRLRRQPRTDRRDRGGSQQRLRSYPAQAGRCARSRSGRPPPGIIGAQRVTCRRTTYVPHPRSSPDRPTYRTASPRPSCAKRGGSHRELANHESTGSRITASRGCTPPPRVRHGPPACL